MLLWGILGERREHVEVKRHEIDFLFPSTVMLKWEGGASCFVPISLMASA